MQRLPRILLAVLSVFALTFAACGGDGISSKSASDVLKETFGPGKPVKSGKLDLRVAFDAKGLPNVKGPLKAALEGPFASSGKQGLPRFAFDLNLDVAGQPIALGAVSTGDKGWLKFANQAFAVDPATFKQFRTLYEQDQKRAATADNPTFQALGVDPTRWLAAPKKAGEASVGGTKTVHVTSKVDVPAFLDDVNKLLGRADAAGAAAATGTTGQVPSKITDAQRAVIEKSIKNTSLDVYAGKDDGILRRLNVQITFDVPADARQSTGGLTTGTLGLDLVISELNKAQTFAAPARSRPLSDLTRGTGATGATGAAAAPQIDSNSPQGRYRTCLQAAGDSVAEVQKCAPLLNGG